MGSIIFHGGRSVEFPKEMHLLQNVAVNHETPAFSVFIMAMYLPPFLCQNKMSLFMRAFADLGSQFAPPEVVPFVRRTGESWSRRFRKPHYLLPLTALPYLSSRARCGSTTSVLYEMREDTEGSLE